MRLPKKSKATRLNVKPPITEAPETLPPFTMTDFERALRQGKPAADPFGKPMGREEG